jgi:hypothetical protein
LITGGGNVSLTLVPVTYQYNCNSSSGGCGTKEEFDFGKDSNNNTYGLVQWLKYVSPSKNGVWTPANKSVFNNLAQWTQTQIQQGEGGTTVSFPCNPL